MCLSRTGEFEPHKIGYSRKITHAKLSPKGPTTHATLPTSLDPRSFSDPCNPRNLAHSFSMFYVGGTDIELVNKVKYLGLHIDNLLTWRWQIENIKGKVSRATGLLKYCKNFVSMETLKDIYCSIVEPHLNYCCSVWGCSSVTRMESLQKLQNRAARNVSGSPHYTFRAVTQRAWLVAHQRNDIERNIYEQGQVIFQ